VFSLITGPKTMMPPEKQPQPQEHEQLPTHKLQTRGIGDVSWSATTIYRVLECDL